MGRIKMDKNLGDVIDIETPDSRVPDADCQTANQQRESVLITFGPALEVNFVLRNSVYYAISQ